MEKAISEILKTAFDPYFKAPIEAWSSFSKLGEIQTFDKEQVIKKADETERYLYFIIKGSGGVLLWHQNNFKCIDLCYESDFFGDYMSFLTEKPSPLEVIVFEKSELFKISKSNFNQLVNNNALGNNICRHASEALFIHKQNQQIEILSKTAKERYIDLQHKHKDIIYRTPQKHIASYLGITPQSLSRIRKELSKTD